MASLIYLAPVLGIVALLFAFVLAGKVNKMDEGTDRMQEIAASIREGARAFLSAEYKILVIFAAVLFILIGFGVSWPTAICFVVGAIFSTLAGFFGMTVATNANVRTANAARTGGMNKALSIAFSGGAVMGMCVVGSGPSGRRRNLCIDRQCRHPVRFLSGCFLHRSVRSCWRRYLHKGCRRWC